MDEFEEVDFSKMSDEELDAYLAEMREKHKTFFAQAARPKAEKPKREVRYISLSEVNKNDPESEPSET